MMKLTIGITLTLFLALSSASVRPADKAQWQFDVYLNENRIGFHRFEVIRQKNRQLVYSKAKFDVNFLFFNAYSYEHDNFEIWENNCLSRIESYTNDNGEKIRVKGSKQDDYFNVASLQNSDNFSGCIKTFAYWDASFLKANRLLNPQTGEYVRVKIQQLNDSQLVVGGKKLPARLFELTGENLKIRLWYSMNNEWLGLESDVDNDNTLRYLLPARTI